MIYAAFPLGLAFLVLGIGGICPIASIIHSAGLSAFFLLSLVGILFMIWPPSWIKPRWLRWLEREYGYGLDILIEEARAVGRWQWEARVRTREGLENWVQGVLEKRERDMYRAWRGWVSYQVGRNTKRVKRKYGGGNIPFDRYMDPYELPYVPEHRKKDYQQYLTNPRQRVLRTFIESLDAGREFTVADLERVCPDLSRKYIRYLLDELRAQKYVTCTGRGRSARWRRV
jgi:hypothetical protein